MTSIQKNRRLTLQRALLLGLTPALQSFPAWANTTPRLKIVTSFSILADITQVVCGPLAEVQSLVGPNSDAHAFEPTPSILKRLKGADLLVVNGLGFETWLGALQRTSGFKGPVIVASEGIKPRKVAGHIDPHAWHDLNHAQAYVHNIKQALIQRAPAQAAELEARAGDYVQQLRDLDREARTLMSSVPTSKRTLITSHDAFGYLGDAYGLTMLAARGWRGHSEPSAGDVARLIRQIRAQEAKAVFLENISDARLIQQIARESGARVGGTLYSDALSAPGGPADTYLKLMAHNLKSIASALQP